MNPFPSECVRFGRFELNVQTGELFSLDSKTDGQKLVLREQPLQILRMLIERDGKIVSREEIQSTLWPNDTIVDFGHSINVAIGVLRRALGDSAANPQYIETLARRGYRLVVTTEWLVSQASVSVNAAIPKDELSHLSLTAIDSPLGLEQAQGVTRPSRHSVRNRMGAAAVLIAIAVGVWAYLQLHNRVMLSVTDTMVRADIDNQTGDTAFGGGLNLAMEIALEQTPYLNILGRDKMRAALTTLNLPDNAKVTDEVARRICLRTGSKMVMESSIADAGNAYRIEIRAIDCKTNEPVAQIRNEVKSRGDVVRALGVSAVETRRKLGEPSDSVAKFNKPLDEATSASPDALALLAQGYSAHLAGNLRGALPDFQRAIELDNNLALAHVSLASVSNSLGQDATAAAEGQKAYQLRERMTEPNRFQVETLYYEAFGGQWDKDFPIASRWVQEFPRDVIARINLAVCLQYLGRHEESLAQGREALRMLRSGPTYGLVIGEDIPANDWDNGQVMFRDAVARKLDSPQLHLLHAMLDFLQQDASAMREDAAWAQQNPSGKYATINLESWFAAFHGQFQDSRQLMRQSAQLAAKESPSIAASYLQNAALEEVEVGNLTQGQQLITDGLKDRRDYNSRVLAALVFARSGKLEDAQKLADAVEREVPQSTSIQNYCLPVIHAAIQLRKNDPAAAIAILRVHPEYDFAYTSAFTELYPVYIRGLAYLQMGQGHLAAAEFQRMLDNQGMIQGFVTGALARLQLARAQAMSGDKAAAATSYQQFLSLWKDADPDIPIYKQARAEYAALHIK